MRLVRHHIEEGFTFQEDHTLRADEHFRINEFDSAFSLTRVPSERSNVFSAPLGMTNWL